MARKLLLSLGIVYAALCIVSDIVAGLLFDGYSYADQAISELSAIGAPTQPMLQVLGAITATALIAFGWAVWHCAGADRRLARAGQLLLALGVSHFAWLLFPMNARGMTATTTDAMHIVLAALTVMLILLSMWSASRTLAAGFRRYSNASMAAVVIGGGATALYAPRVAANLPTPWMGLAERFNYYAFMFWVMVFAVMLMRRAHGDRGRYLKA